MVCGRRGSRAAYRTQAVAVYLAGVADLLPSAFAKPPRQPPESYLKVPEVPEPPSYALAELFSEVEGFSDLDNPARRSDAIVDEEEFVAVVEKTVRRAAKKTWKSLDTNEDGQLGLEELSAAVKTWQKEKDGQKKFNAPHRRWAYMWLLAQHFLSSDLTRSARVGIPALDADLKAMLASVAILDERKALFDAIAGDGIGDDGGGFSQADWEAWRKNELERLAKRKARARRRRQGSADGEL
eukprot:TRINITY_DN69175_c0_g1_i1.p1 TRINITY_DN69175_c0_g1~~TRINITY_DN69175_c0_g1_i1.p1  ORF type:complete len:240 (-),score=42.71 TRINITY_DN69175_c0_g1_i1:70-789(-)